MQASRVQSSTTERFLELLCLGLACSLWRDRELQRKLPFAPGTWKSSLSRSGNVTDGVCAATVLRCTDIAPGTSCNTPNKQKCSDLVEMRGPLGQKQHKMYQGSVLTPERAWWPPRLPDELVSSVLPCLSSSCLYAENTVRTHAKDAWHSLDFLESMDDNALVRYRPGHVPMLQQEVHAHGPWPRISPLPCSSARMEDAVILRSFFVDHEGQPLSSNGATFLEIGGLDGIQESETLFFESCLGWSGILVEAHPDWFNRLHRNRPSSLKLRVAACEDFGWVQFTGIATTYSRANNSKMALPSWALQNIASSGKPPLIIRCGPLGHYLSRLGVDRIDFMSIDVEGSEIAVIKSLFGRKYRVSVGVIMLEVRGDGQRRQIVQVLLAAGFMMIGQIYAKPTSANEVVNDVYMNQSHMKTFFPQSRALRIGGEVL